MNIKKLTLANFMKHDRTEINFPPVGVAVVTGENGSGKSSLIEAVAVSLWGETLRGASGWRASNVASEVVVDTDIGWSRRFRRATTNGTPHTVLDWSAEGVCPDAPGASASARLTTKAQEELTAHFGPFEIWRRTHVFSSSDASHFATSRDSDRKRLLEEILHLSRFDSALAACRLDLRGARDHLLTVTSNLRVLEERLCGMQSRISDAEKALSDLHVPGDLTVLEKERKRLALMADSCAQDIASVRSAMKAGNLDGAGFLAAARQAEQQLERLGASTCPVCCQAIPDALRVQLRSRVESLRRDAAKAQEENKKEVAALTDQLDEMEEEEVAVRAKQQAVIAELRSARDAQTARAAAEKRLEVVRSESEVVMAELVKCKEGVEQAAAASAELEAVESVLGLKGVRAHVLGRALSGIEQVANSWLTKIAGEGLSLRLRPYSEKRDGGVSDSISLEVLGAGGGHGYKGASGGERRRIDVALLLALAEVAQAAHGQRPGTLFLDEVFDALDLDGITRVSGVVSELARERAVVVITHNPDLVEILRPTLRLHVQDGKLV